MAQQIDVNDNFPEGFYEEFARLAIAFGRLEYMVKLCLKDLLGQGFTQGMVEGESLLYFKKLCQKAQEQAKTRLCPVQVAPFCTLIGQAMTLGMV
ncbi:hypothetical protein [Azotobacter chroococcum]|uniref:hypothetical protein n=1 Tax=Azotobacter chroococcum TaxID=353 RepID=UPI000B6029C0|nr:hypothetical protein [Azotobacter chroococcum]ASL27620.1 hypothetical protein ACG10_15965 [Azotobacter chroococcum]